MNRKSQNAGGPAALAVLAVFGLGTAATADPYPGTLTTLTNGAGNTHNLFTISGSTVTVTGDISGANTYFLDGTQLVGFRTLYLVKSGGSATSGVSTAASGGFVRNGTTLIKTFYDSTPALGRYTGYDDGGPGKGFTDGSDFLVVADPALAGKAASNNDTFGSFSFSQPIGAYNIGLDYILKGGATGRAYFAPPGNIPSPPAVPEPGSLVSMALGSLGLAGLVLRARRRQTRQTV